MLHYHSRIYSLNRINTIKSVFVIPVPQCLQNNCSFCCHALHWDLTVQPWAPNPDVELQIFQSRATGLVVCVDCSDCVCMMPHYAGNWAARALVAQRFLASVRLHYQSCSCAIGSDDRAVVAKILGNPGQSFCSGQSHGLVWRLHPLCEVQQEQAVQIRCSGAHGHGVGLLGYTQPPGPQHGCNHLYPSH